MSETAGKKSETNIKDTIESILVAFILAFIFRCFVVEAFVIPTGSMAPTLMGAHMNFRCPDCGYSFTVGYNSNSEVYAIDSHLKGSITVHCPNCGYQLPPDLSSDPDNDAKDAPLQYGDRILVMKYLYLFNDPQRWDVVVFKSPVTSEGDYSVNYIKRLIGRPGESIVVCNGDVFVAPPGAERKDLAAYVVQTKPRHVQDALWRIVFDADYVPQLSAGDSVARKRPWAQPWKMDSGWINNDSSKSVSEREFVFDNRSGSGALWLDPSANYSAAQFTDKLAYNQTSGAPPQRQVGDLKLEFFLSGLEGEGTVKAVVHKQTDDLKGRNEFVAELSHKGVRLVMHTPRGEKVIGEKSLDLSGSHHVTLQNVDYRVELRIDDEMVFATTKDDYTPDLSTLAQHAADPASGGVRIEGDRVSAKVQHLRVWRDVYYREDGGRDPIRRAYVSPGEFVPVTLAADQFFVLGDNSAMSLDGRYWNDEIKLEGEKLDVPAGVVPARFMLGKAFFVYWPAGYKPASSVPVSLIPNFGEMRFIR